MGEEKQTSTTSTTVKPTKEERELNRLALERARSAQGGLIGLQGKSLDLGQLLAGGGTLPGQFGGLFGGITPEMAHQMAAEGTKNLPGFFQQSGILDSGVAADITAGSYADILRNTAEFNIGNKLNLLNMALGGQAQIQSPILSSELGLGQRLAGLRKTTGTTTQTGMNPFLKSLQTGFGSTLGESAGRGVGSFLFG